MCSIQTIETPVASNLLDRLDEFEDLGFGETSRDLVEEQQTRLRRQGPGKFETLAIEQASGSLRPHLPCRAFRTARAPRRRRPRVCPATDRWCRTSNQRARSRTRSDPRTAVGSGRSCRRRGGSAHGPATWSDLRPPRLTVPWSGRRSPATRLSSVVLPAPLGPTMPRASPSATSNEKSCTTRSAPKRFDSSTTSSNAPTEWLESGQRSQCAVDRDLWRLRVVDHQQLERELASADCFCHCPPTSEVGLMFFGRPFLP